MPASELLAPWTPAEGRQRAAALHRARFGREPALVATAPGRVNLIGEHTDYNAGLCLPIALPHATYAALSGRDDGLFRLASSATDTPWQGRAADLGSASGWAAYVAGVVWALEQEHLRTTGLDIAVTGCVPLGAGLSSSASLECATGLAVMTYLNAPAGPASDHLLISCGVRAENEVAGASTGGMDQSIAVRGRAGQALLLDFRDGEFAPTPFDPAAAGLSLIVVDTRVHHALNDGGYASRRADCEAAAALLGVATLREAPLPEVETIAEDRVRRRARHVVTEIARVSACAEALGYRDWAAVGDLMRASHASMRDDFEISVPELDAVVETALAAGALGARMTGGGFGGSAIALAPTAAVPELRGAVDATFAARGWPAPGHLDGVASAAARVLTQWPRES